MDHSSYENRMAEINQDNNINSNYNNNRRSRPPSSNQKKSHLPNEQDEDEEYLVNNYSDEKLTGQHHQAQPLNQLPPTLPSNNGHNKYHHQSNNNNEDQKIRLHSADPQQNMQMQKNSARPLTALAPPLHQPMYQQQQAPPPAAKYNNLFQINTSNTKGKFILHDKERLYEDIIVLRNKINALTKENGLLKTKLLSVDTQMNKYRKMYEDKLTENVNPYEIPKAGMKHESSLALALKKQVKELIKQNQEKENEINSIKKTLKYTKMNELEIQNKTITDEYGKILKLYETLAAEHKNKMSECDSFRDQAQMQAHYIEKVSKENSEYQQAYEFLANEKSRTDKIIHDYTIKIKKLEEICDHQKKQLITRDKDIVRMRGELARSLRCVDVGFKKNSAEESIDTHGTFGQNNSKIEKFQNEYKPPPPSNIKNNDPIKIQNTENIKVQNKDIPKIQSNDNNSKSMQSNDNSKIHNINVKQPAYHAPTNISPNNQVIASSVLKNNSNAKNVSAWQAPAQQPGEAHSKKIEIDTKKLGAKVEVKNEINHVQSPQNIMKKPVEKTSVQEAPFHSKNINDSQKAIATVPIQKEIIVQPKVELEKKPPITVHQLKDERDYLFYALALSKISTNKFIGSLVRGSSSSDFTSTKGTANDFENSFTKQPGMIKIKDSAHKIIRFLSQTQEERNSKLVSIDPNKLISLKQLEDNLNHLFHKKYQNIMPIFMQKEKCAEKLADISLEFTKKKNLLVSALTASVYSLHDLRSILKNLHIDIDKEGFCVLICEILDNYSYADGSISCFPIKIETKQLFNTTLAEMEETEENHEEEEDENYEEEKYEEEKYEEEDEFDKEHQDEPEMLNKQKTPASENDEEETHKSRHSQVEEDEKNDQEEKFGAAKINVRTSSEEYEAEEDIYQENDENDNLDFEKKAEEFVQESHSTTQGRRIRPESSHGRPQSTKKTLDSYKEIPSMTLEKPHPQQNQEEEKKNSVENDTARTVESEASMSTHNPQKELTEEESNQRLSGVIDLRGGGRPSQQKNNNLNENNQHQNHNSTHNNKITDQENEFDDESIEKIAGNEEEEEQANEEKEERAHVEEEEEPNQNENLSAYHDDDFD